MNSQSEPPLTTFLLLRRNPFIIALLVVGMTLHTSMVARSESLQNALIQAYQNNPTLNAQRASSRSIDEEVAIARSGYRPNVNLNSEIGYLVSRSKVMGLTRETELAPGEIGLTVNQTLWDGNRTKNQVSSALSNVRSSHEALRETEQEILLDAAEAFLDVIRDRAVLELQRKNLDFLNEQVASEESRKRVGESTKTDVAQAQADQAAAKAGVSAAIAQLKTSIAIYIQVVGTKPKNLKYEKISLNFPANLAAGIRVAEVEHPALVSAKHDIDKASFDIKTAESELLPRVDLTAKAARNFDQTVTTNVSEEYSLSATLEVPIYQAGRQSATIRQNKELLSQRQIELVEATDTVRAQVISAYADYESSLATENANLEQLRAAALAVQGVVKEREVGQRTTLDVLRTQSALIDAQVELENSKRDARYARFAIMSAIGRLSISNISKKVKQYRPVEHLEAVQDKWFGLRTVGGQ